MTSKRYRVRTTAPDPDIKEHELIHAGDTAFYYGYLSRSWIEVEVASITPDFAHVVTKHDLRYRGAGGTTKTITAGSRKHISADRLVRWMPGA